MSKLHRYTFPNVTREVEYYSCEEAGAEISRLRLALKKINSIASSDREIIVRLSADALCPTEPAETLEKLTKEFIDEEADRKEEPTTTTELHLPWRKEIVVGNGKASLYCIVDSTDTVVANHMSLKMVGAIVEAVNGWWGSSDGSGACAADCADLTLRRQIERMENENADLRAENERLKEELKFDNKEYGPDYVDRLQQTIDERNVVNQQMRELLEEAIEGRHPDALSKLDFMYRIELVIKGENDGKKLADSSMCGVETHEGTALSGRTLRAEGSDSSPAPLKLRHELCTASFYSNAARIEAHAAQTDAGYAEMKSWRKDIGAALDRYLGRIEALEANQVSKIDLASLDARVEALEQ